MAVEVSFAMNGPVRLAHSIIDAAAGDPAVAVVQFNMLGPASLAEIGTTRWPGCSAPDEPEIPQAEVMVDLEAPEDMVLSLGLGRAGLDALVEYLTGVQRDWAEGKYR